MQQEFSNTFDRDSASRIAGSVSLRTVASQTAGADVETPVFVCTSGSLVQNVLIRKVFLIPSAAITGAATNLQTFSLKKYTSAGVATGTGYGAITGTNFVTTSSLGKFNTSVALNTSDISLVPGDILTLVDAHGASGAATPELTVVVEYTLNSLPSS